MSFVQNNCGTIVLFFENYDWFKRIVGASAQIKCELEGMDDDAKDENSK
jgi:hypothetical protein